MTASVVLVRRIIGDGRLMTLANCWCSSMLASNVQGKEFMIAVVFVCIAYKWKEKTRTKCNSATQQAWIGLELRDHTKNVNIIPSAQ
jgi:hypothetical protein